MPTDDPQSVSDKPELFSRVVFLDTQVFHSNNYDFESNSLKILRDLKESERIELVTSQVVIREVQRRMKLSFEEAKPLINALRKKARILFSIPDSPFSFIRRGFDASESMAAMQTQLDEFLDSLDFVILTNEQVNVDQVLDSYFGSKPPFGKGNKRNEFPDAISMQALIRWAEDQEKFAYVVSEDEDLKNACAGEKRVKHLHSLEEFYDIENRHHEDLAWLENAFKSQNELIEEAVKEVFEGSYYALEDEEGDSDSAVVRSIEISEINVLQVGVEDAEIQANCAVEVSVDFSYDDPNTTIWDEGTKYSFGTVDVTLDRTVYELVSVSVEIDRVNRKITSASSNQYEMRFLNVHEDDDD